MITIRAATSSDVPTILALVHDLALYEKEPDAVVATEADFLREGFGSTPSFEVLLAFSDETPVGFALFFFTFSTWRGRRCLHLEDLFVKPEHRHHGAGLALMRALAREAVGRGCARFGWQVLDWNSPAIAFYEALGAKIQREWLSMRLEDDALRALADARRGE